MTPALDDLLTEMAAKAGPFALEFKPGRWEPEPWMVRWDWWGRQGTPGDWSRCEGGATAPEALTRALTTLATLRR